MEKLKITFKPLRRHFEGNHELKTDVSCVGLNEEQLLFKEFSSVVDISEFHWKN